MCSAGYGTRLAKQDSGELRASNRPPVQVSSDYCYFVQAVNLPHKIPKSRLPPWYVNGPPADKELLAIWRFRAALVDAFVYEP